MKFWKKVSIIFGSFLILVCFFLSKDIFTKVKNKSNFKLVENGMSKQQVLNVMGEPDFKYLNLKSDSVYYYDAPPLSSEGFEVSFNTHDQASKIK
ncbi:DUF3192 domain-containing protein [Algoriphagus halophytocola]|uniref:DUF3192 domain-containing protein n=1 Tax=Algoriphagus halophytocola TaxID=2991499 RepID=A0ABY6MEP0_9BACT|nr:MULTISPECIES: DUF3192 domain-containing protein [unclassified Algoriphagus]UZD22083.1 DUF3192 domain-containing protein [Algoriphagus sp. TR-M5]WBL43334.1 DUF3192 domain-containing protein [Algoriphagus sp. TR-M9]